MNNVTPAGKDEHLVFAEQFYYPDGWGGAQLPRDITMGLASAGWKVRVVCGSDPYAPPIGAAQLDPSSVGVRIQRVPRLLSGDIHRRKLLRQLWFYVAAFPMLLFGRASIYVAQTNPPLIVPIAAIVAWLRRRPLIIIAQDLYPEVLLAHGMVAERGLPARVLGGLFRWAYRRAARVVSLGPCMTRRLLDKGVAPERIVQISNWSTGESDIVRGPENRLRQEWQLEGKFVLLYSGNLGVAHDVETLMQAVAQALPQIPQLRLVFVGAGGRIGEAKALAAKLGIEHAVQFQAFVPFEMLPHSLGVADLALVTLRRGFEGLVVPSKLLGHLARGVPTLYIGPDSDVSFYVKESGGGYCCANDDVEGLVRMLLELSRQPDAVARVGAQGQRFYETHLTQDLGVARYQSVLREVAEQPTVGSELTAS